MDVTAWVTQGYPHTSHKHMYWILHLAFSSHARIRQHLIKWMRQDWLGLCSSPLKPHGLNYLLFLHFRVEAIQSHWEEKPRCNHWLTICNWSWTRSIWPVTPTTTSLAPGTRRACGHGVWIHWEPTANKLILKKIILWLATFWCLIASSSAAALDVWAPHHSGDQTHLPESWQSREPEDCQCSVNP